MLNMNKNPVHFFNKKFIKKIFSFFFNYEKTNDKIIIMKKTTTNKI